MELQNCISIVSNNMQKQLNEKIHHRPIFPIAEIM